MTFKEPRLLQRLNPPIFGELSLNDMALGFDRGTITKLNQFFSFDYMGSPKFEMGALPRAMAKFMKHYKSDEMVKYLKTVEVDQAPYHYHRAPRNSKYVSIWIVGPVAYMDNIVEFIESEAAGLHGDFDERTFLQEAVFDNEAKNDGVLNGNRRIGWFDLENSFMFFIDEKPFKEFTNAIESALTQQAKAESKPSAVPIARP